MSINFYLLEITTEANFIDFQISDTRILTLDNTSLKIVEIFQFIVRDQSYIYLQEWEVKKIYRWNFPGLFKNFY